MIKDLINELKTIDDRLEPNEIKFIKNKRYFSIAIIYSTIEVAIDRDMKYTIYSYDDGESKYHFIYSVNHTAIFDLIMLLYNNKEKITEIVLKYI